MSLCKQLKRKSWFMAHRMPSLQHIWFEPYKLSTSYSSELFIKEWGNNSSLTLAQVACCISVLLCSCLNCALCLLPAGVMEKGCVKWLKVSSEHLSPAVAPLNMCRPTTPASQQVSHCLHETELFMFSTSVFHSQRFCDTCSIFYILYDIPDFSS